MRYHEIQIQQHQAARLLNRDYSLTRENILGDGLKLCRRAKAFNTSDHTTAYIRVVDEDGFTMAKLEELMDVKNRLYGRVDEYAKRVNAQFVPGKTPWHVPVDVALPCATQNELNGDDARMLVKNGVMCVAEGANMPSTLDAVHVFEDARVLYAPGKASNAGGVATSGPWPESSASRCCWS